MTSDVSRLNRRKFVAGATAVGAAMAVNTIAAPAVLAQARQPIKIGMLNSFSKVFAVLGEHQMNGINLWLSHNGNVLGGHEVTIIKEDDEVSPPVGLQKLRKLVESDRVDLVLGPQASNVAMAMVDYVRSNEVFWVCSGAGTTALTYNRIPYMFRTTLSSWQLAVGMSQWFSENIGKEAVLMASDYAGGRDVVGEFKHVFVKSGGKIIKEIYPPLGTNDYSAYLADLRSIGAKGLYCFFAGTDALRFVKQYDEYGLKKITRFCTAGFAVESDTLPAQGAAALGITSVLQYADGLETPENKKFVEGYQAAHKMRPSIYAEYGYTTAAVLDAALKMTNGDVSDKKKLADAMTRVKITSPRGPLSIDPVTHNVIDNVYIREVVRAGNQFSNKVIATYQNVRDPGVKDG